MFSLLSDSKDFERGGSFGRGLDLFEDKIGDGLLVLAIKAFLLCLDLDGFSEDIDIVVFSASDVVLVLF
jgi:hypothetical protein